MTLLLPYQLAMIRTTIQKRQAHNYQMIALRSSGALTSSLEKSDATLSLVHLDMIDTRSSRKQQGQQQSPSSAEGHTSASDHGSGTVSGPRPPPHLPATVAINCGAACSSPEHETFSSIPARAFHRRDGFAHSLRVARSFSRRVGNIASAHVRRRSLICCQFSCQPNAMDHSSDP
jgi:hypothetical protein